MTTASLVALRCHSCNGELRATAATLRLMATLMTCVVAVCVLALFTRGPLAMAVTAFASCAVASFTLSRHATFDIDEDGRRHEALASACRRICSALFALMALVGAGLMVVSAVATGDGSDAFTALAPGFIYGGLAVGLKTRDRVTWRVSVAMTGMVVFFSLFTFPTLVEFRGALTDGTWAAELAKIEISRWEVASLASVCVLSIIAFAALILWRSSWSQPVGGQSQ